MTKPHEQPQTDFIEKAEDLYFSENKSMKAPHPQPSKDEIIPVKKYEGDAELLPSEAIHLRTQPSKEGDVRKALKRAERKLFDIENKEVEAIETETAITLFQSLLKEERRKSFEEGMINMAEHFSVIGESIAKAHQEELASLTNDTTQEKL